MIILNFVSHLPVLYLWIRMDPVGAISMLSDYVIRQSISYWGTRALSVGSVSLGERLLAPAKDVAIIHDYVFQSRSVDELTGRVGNVATDALAGVSVFTGTDQFLTDKIPGAGGALLGAYVGEKIVKYNATLVAQATAGELLHKRIATLSVLEKLIQSTSPYMQQSIPGMSIMHFLNVQTNIAVTVIAVGLKMALRPFFRRRNEKKKMDAARNSIRKIFNEDAIDVNFFEVI